MLGVLVLQPVLDTEGPMRLVASGVGDEPVRWIVDGHWVATTRDGQAARVHLAAGPHHVEAQSAAAGTWRALARADPEGPSWLAVPAWSAEHVNRVVPDVPASALMALLLLAGATRSKRL